MVHYLWVIIPAAMPTPTTITTATPAAFPRIVQDVGSPKHQQLQHRRQRRRSIVVYRILRHHAYGWMTITISRPNSRRMDAIKRNISNNIQIIGNVGIIMHPQNPPLSIIIRTIIVSTRTVMITSTTNNCTRIMVGMMRNQIHRHIFVCCMETVNPRWSLRHPRTTATGNERDLVEIS